MKCFSVGVIVLVGLLGSCAKSEQVFYPPSSRVSAQSPSAPFTILLSNDDGYDAPGIRALIDALGSLGRIVVAAPAREQSGQGHALTLRQPVLVSELKQPDGTSWYAIDGPPATCVRLAIESLLSVRPQLVVSGINRGDNLGATVYHSGTVGAAREGAIAGIPSIAVSIRGDDHSDYQAAAAFTRDLIVQLRAQNHLRPGLLLNVNVPAGERKGVRVARLSVLPRHDTFEGRTGPRGQRYFWPDWRQLDNDVDGTDVAAFVRGYITVTPMQLDVTSLAHLKDLRAIEGRD
jgi:5'-nucleotidase